MGRDFSTHFTDVKTEAQRMNESQGHAIGSWTQNSSLLTVGIPVNFT